MWEFGFFRPEKPDSNYGGGVGFDPGCTGGPALHVSVRNIALLLL